MAKQHDASAAPAAADHYAAMHGNFRWLVPPDFNIAEACCGRWARDTPDATAIHHETEAGERRRISYADLQRDANRLSGLLRNLGVQRGDRVAIVMPQRPETAVAHIAIHQLGAVAMPLAMLFGPEALEYRLQNSEATLAIVDESAITNLLAARPQCPQLKTVLAVGGAQGQGDVDWDRSLPAHPDSFTRVATTAEDPAILIYTSGTTGPAKGALLPQRALIGNLTGFICSQNWFGFDPLRGTDPVPSGRTTQESGTSVPLPSGKRAREMGHAGPLPPGKREREMGGVNSGQSPVGGDQKTPCVFWSPADWAWTGGLMDALLPTLYFGRAIVAFQGRFSPEKAFELLERYRVTHTFLFPTALKAMMKAVPNPRERYRLELQAIMSAGEAVGDAVFAFCEQQLGVTVNEMFGQTEINYIVGNCAMNNRRHGHGVGWPARPGSMGRPYPGHRIAVIDDEGMECPRGTPGDVALHRLDIHGEPDPIVFLGYWRNDDATRGKFTGDPSNSWCRTGDTAVMDDDGYLWYQGRSDDIFKVAGYRIGPSEIENCLVKHPAVANAAVVPKPDPARGALVKAYVVLAPGHSASDALIEDLQQHVRGRLAPYEYPKEIEFIDVLPMTTTGKVQRRVLRLQEEERAAAAAAAGGR
ncbi:acyl-CoA synthetase [Piscinibacter sakaiensis]|uniref:acyl-CoA synthetase n=1 Tax=Piscinibacter sakaiensis TaxID=1547922 RepID=UPI003AB0BC04